MRVSPTTNGKVTNQNIYPSLAPNPSLFCAPGGGSHSTSNVHITSKFDTSDSVSSSGDEPPNRHEVNKSDKKSVASSGITSSLSLDTLGTGFLGTDLPTSLSPSSLFAPHVEDTSSAHTDVLPISKKMRTGNCPLSQVVEAPPVRPDLVPQLHTSPLAAYSNRASNLPPRPVSQSVADIPDISPFFSETPPTHWLPEPVFAPVSATGHPTSVPSSAHWMPTALPANATPALRCVNGGSISFPQNDPKEKWNVPAGEFSEMHVSPTFAPSILHAQKNVLLDAAKRSHVYPGEEALSMQCSLDLDSIVDFDSDLLADI